MALVSSSLPIHMRQEHMFVCNRDSIVQTMSNVVEIEEEVEEGGDDGGAEQVEKIYVAVGKEYKESKEALIWALRYVSKEKMIVLLHVHRPAKKIPIMGAKFPANQLQEEEVRAFREKEKRNMNDTLNNYLALCSLAKIRADKLVIEMEDVDKGLVELVVRHGITKLVMGAAADRKLKALKSKTAIRVQKQAEPSCKIWFVCKGYIILTRDMLQGTGLTMSPVTSLNSSNPRQLKLKSRSTQQFPTTSLDWLVSPNPRSNSINYHASSSNNLCSSRIYTDPLEGSSNSTYGEVLSKDEDNEMNTLMLPSAHESERNLEFSRPETESTIDIEIYDLLQNALKEAEDKKNEAYRESCRRKMAEIEAIAAARNAKASENLYAKELKQRKETEVKLASEKLELEKRITHYKELMDKLQKANRTTSNMELQIAESQRITKDFQDKLSEAKNLLTSLHRELDESQQERTNVFTGLEEHTANMEFDYSEFRYEEIVRATDNFDSSLKIGEGEYGCVYKGLLRHTTVAIKVLNSESMQGKAEFYREVQILSRVRHRNLVTLIGTCPEALALVYEYLPNGSLEDRLQCKGNTPPLPWHIRTRIISEICLSLIFLYSHKLHTIVHRNINPANILLSTNFESRLGLGDFGYMDPEFMATGELRPHCDTYSLGLVILRILTGKPVLGIIEDVREAMEEDKLHEILDITAGDWPFVQAKQLANLGLRCCEFDRMNRPDLEKDAWRVLQPMVKASLSVGLPDGKMCVPSYFICPIFQEIMRDPHIAADGYTYEAEAVRGWIDSGHSKSPMTNFKLSHHNVMPNRALRSVIEECLEKHM